MLLLALLACQTKHLRTDDGRWRDYRVTEPADTSGRLPVLLALHGGGGNAQDFQASGGLDELAAEGVLVVYPNGIGDKRLGQELNTWNGGYCCGQAVDEGVDDVAFLSELVDELDRRWGIDRERVYVTGHSNGGIMAHRIAFEAPELIAGFAPVGSPGPDPEWSGQGPVAVQIIHGTADNCALYEGGEACGGCWEQVMEQAWGWELDERSFACLGVEEQAARWREINQCGGAEPSVSWSQGEASCTRWTDCEAPVEVCAIEGAGHAWPGGEGSCTGDSDFCVAYREVVGVKSDDFEAAERMWEFFSGL